MKNISNNKINRKEVKKMIRTIAKIASALALLLGFIFVYVTLSTDDYITSCASKGIATELVTPWHLLITGIILFIVGIGTICLIERKNK